MAKDNDNISEAITDLTNGVLKGSTTCMGILGSFMKNFSKALEDAIDETTNEKKDEQKKTDS